MSTYNIERLKHLSDILKNVKPENFRLNIWHCGTAACAVGHACMDPVFNAQGLSLYRFINVPIYEDATGWGAVKEFFGLSWRKAHYLFDADEYPQGRLGEPRSRPRTHRGVDRQ